MSMYALPSHATDIGQGGGVYLSDFFTEGRTPEGNESLVHRSRVVSLTSTALIPADIYFYVCLLLQRIARGYENKVNKRVR